MADTHAPGFVSSLAQPYIDRIQGQVGRLSFSPSGAQEAISAQISGSSSASGSSGQSALPVQVSASGGSDAGAAAGDASSAAVGSAYAQPTIDYIRQQINSLLAASIANSISANFPSDSSSGMGGSAVRSSVPAGVQTFLAPNAEPGDFLSTLGDQSS